MKTKKIWKEYPLDFEFEGTYRIEVSNEGDFKTYNTLHPEGKIIKGSLQGGFPIVRAKLFKKRSETDEKIIAEIQDKIDILNVKIKELKFLKENKEQKKNLQIERDALIQKRKKQNARINKKRSISFAVMIHRAVAELFLEKPGKDQKFIIHKDFDKLNNHVDNLAWASQEELNGRYMQHPKNVLYQFKKQFQEVKPNTSMGKLTENEVLVIKKRLKKGYTLKRLAKQFGVSDMQIHRIKTGENWQHVKLIEDLLGENEQ